MNREEYLSQVWKRIGSLPPEDIRRSLDYYRELIDDRMEEGMTEAEAVAAMPSVEEAAAQILADMPVPPETESGGAGTPGRRSCKDEACGTPNNDAVGVGLDDICFGRRQELAGAQRARHNPGFWTILLLVLGSPLWLPLVITVGVLVLVAYILVWVAVVVVFAVLLSFGASGVAWIIYGVVQLFTGGLVRALFYVGGAILCAGMLLLLLPVCKWAVKGAVWLAKLPFRRRGGATQ